MIKAVIFDLDDTLISEKSYIESGYKHVSCCLGKELGIDKNIIYNDLIELFKVEPFNVFNRLYEKYDYEYSREMILSLVEEYRSHPPTIKLYDDVMPCLDKLRTKGIKTGIITDGYKIAQHQKLVAINAVKYFDEIIITDELGRDYWKPHSKAFEIMKEKQKVEFQEMVYIGDNPTKDFISGNILGMTTIRIIRENGIYSKLEGKASEKADYKVRSLSEIKLKQVYSRR